MNIVMCMSTFLYIRIQYVIRELYVCMCVHGLSGASNSETPWIVALQCSLSVRFSGQEYWSWVAVYFSRGSS